MHSPAKRPRQHSLNDIQPQSHVIHSLHDIHSQHSPFVPPNARGMSVRRHSNIAVHGAHPVMSPPQGGMGGLNLHANWPAFGNSMSIASQEYSGVFGPPSAGLAGGFDMGIDERGIGGGGPAADERYLSPGPKGGLGHIPIGIRPSIQAQSAMLRELYPNGAGAAGLLPVP